MWAIIIYTFFSIRQLYWLSFVLNVRWNDDRCCRMGIMYVTHRFGIHGLNLKHRIHLGSDLLGRSTAFNLTLCFTAIFGLVASYAPSFPTLCMALFFLGTSVGVSTREQVVCNHLINLQRDQCRRMVHYYWSICLEGNST